MPRQPLLSIFHVCEQFVVKVCEPATEKMSLYSIFQNFGISKKQEVFLPNLIKIGYREIFSAAGSSIGNKVQVDAELFIPKFNTYTSTNTTIEYRRIVVT